MRSKYASIEIAGTFRAWKHRVAFGEERATDEAENREVRGGSDGFGVELEAAFGSEGRGDVVCGVVDDGRLGVGEESFDEEGDGFEGCLNDEEVLVLWRLVDGLAMTSSGRLFRMKLLPRLRLSGIG
jgi:hypothetical protein